MAFEKSQQYLVEYIVNANVSNASSALKALATDAQKFKKDTQSAFSGLQSTTDKLMAAKKAFSKNMMGAMDLTAPLNQMATFQNSLATMMESTMRGMTGMITGNAKSVQKALTSLRTEGFANETAFRNMSNGLAKTMLVSEKSIGKTRTELAKYQKQLNVAQAMKKKLDTSTFTGKFGSGKFEKAQQDLYKTLKEKGEAKLRQNLDKYITGIQQKATEAAQSIRASEDRRNAVIAKAIGSVNNPNFGIGAKLTGNFDEKAEVFRKLTNNVRKLAKLEQTNFNIKVAVSVEKTGMAKLDTLLAKMREIKAASNVTVKVSTKGASKSYKEGLNNMKSIVETNQRLVNGMVGYSAKPGVTAAGTVPVLGEVIGTINNMLNSAGEVGVKGFIIDIINGVKKAAGTVGVEGLITNIVQDMAKPYSVKTEALVENVKNIGNTLKTIPVEAIAEMIKPKKGLDPMPVEVKPIFKDSGKATKEMFGTKAVPINVKPQWGTTTTGTGADKKTISSWQKFMESVSRRAAIPVKIKPTLDNTKDKDGKTAWSRLKDSVKNMSGLRATVKLIPDVKSFREAVAAITGLAAPVSAGRGGSTTAPASASSGSTTVQPSSSKNVPPAGRRTPVRSRSASMYPLVGNTSFGVQTPAIVSMAKGMVGMMGIGAAFGLIGDAMSQAVQYQNTMVSVKSILESNKHLTGYTPTNFKQMEQNIRNVGMDTKFTAPEVAGAARFMAMAGLGVNEINSSIRPIADVALIGDNDLQTTADKITNIQTAFKLGKDPKAMRKLADNLTTTFTRFNTDMMMTAEAMQYAAPIASAAGLGIEDTLAMIGVMGNAGIQSSMAGTTLRMAMQNIYAPNKKQKKIWEKLGIQVYNGDKTPRNIVDILGELRAKTSDKELFSIVTDLFRATSRAGAAQIIRNLDKVVSTRNDMLSGQDTGISSRLSLEKQNTIAGLWAQVTSAFTEDNVKVFERFQGKLKEMLMDIRDYLKGPEAVENLENIMELVKTMGSAFGTVAKVWMGIYNTFPDAVKSFMVIQFALSQIGMLLNPFIGLYRVIKNIGVSAGIVGAAGAGSGVISGVLSTAARFEAIHGRKLPLGAHFSKAFTAARGAGALSLSGVGASAATGLGSILGALLSPISLSLITIVGITTGIAKSIAERNKAINDFERRAEESRNNLKDVRELMGGTSAKTERRTGSRVYAGNISSGYSSRSKALNPMLRNTKNYSLLFRNGDILHADPNKYIDEIYNSFYVPRAEAEGLGTSKYMFYSRMGITGFNNSSDNELGISDAAARSVAVKAQRFGIDSAIQSIALGSGNYRWYSNKVLSMFDNASKIKDKAKKIEAFEKAREYRDRVVAHFNSAGLKELSLSSMNNDQIGNLTVGKIMNTPEYNQAIANNILQLTSNDSPTMKRYVNIEKIAKLGENQINERMRLMRESIDSLDASGVDIDNNNVDLNLQIKNGVLSYEEYLSKVKAFKLKVDNTVASFLDLALQAARVAAGGDPNVDIYAMQTDYAFGVGKKLSKDESAELIRRGEAYALEKGIDRSKFSLTNGKHAFQRSDIIKVNKWYDERINKGKNNAIKNVIDGLNGSGGNGNTGNNGTSNNPYQIDQSGYSNKYAAQASRPTQIIFNIENMAKFDGNEFLSADDKEIANKIMPRVVSAVTQAFATAQAQMGAMTSSQGVEVG